MKSDLSSPVGTFLVQAASLIHEQQLSYCHASFPLEDIIRSFHREAIYEVWQLEHLDSYQWKCLGVQMGLVASVRHCLAEQRRAQSKTSQECQKADKSPSNSRRQPEKITTATTMSAEVKTSASGLTKTSALAKADATSPVSMTVASTLFDDNKENHELQCVETNQTLPQSNAGSKSPAAISPKSHAPESVDTFFPPTMPERKSSYADANPGADEAPALGTLDDHWNISCATSPVLPTRWSSTEIITVEREWSC